MADRTAQTGEERDSLPARHHREQAFEGSGGGVVRESLVKPRRLSAQAKEVLRRRIVNGELHSGQIYSVPSLAAVFGVSATPVREALVELAIEGFVEALPNQGFRVVRLSEHDLDEIFQVRLMLEVPGLAEVARLSLDEANFVAFGQMAKDMERYAETGEIAEYLSTDRAFHLGLLSFLGNGRLLDAVAEVGDQARVYGVPFLIERGELINSARQHADIVSAIVRSDLEAVAEIARHHIERTRGVWANMAEKRLR